MKIPGTFSKPLRRDPDTGSVTDVESQRLVGAVLQELHPPARLWNYVNIDYGGHLSKLSGI